MTGKPRRFYVVTPDNSAAAGFENTEGAEAAAVAYGDGAHVVDTEAMPYQPSVRVVEGGEIAYVGFGMFDSRKGAGGGLIEAAKKGFPPLVRAYLAKGADPNSTDPHGGTALHWAVAAGNEEAVRMILAEGADPNLPDGKGAPPLKLAEERNKPKIIKLLKDAGAHS
ncbi:MAG: ankyrin repeat domain-containing protein [Rhodospirillales bacterium]|nr:ankyrin repeat domain-containing protein [Rhodospirillales bacterium]